MYIVVLVTCANKKQAGYIASGLVKSRLAACVNIIDKINSIFWWKGKVDRAKECLLVIKSKRDQLNKVMKLVKLMHSYEVPEIIALPISAGYRPYLRWLDASVRRTG